MTFRHMVFIAPALAFATFAWAQSSPNGPGVIQDIASRSQCAAHV